jgi:hypothetical protein
MKQKHLLKKLMNKKDVGQWRSVHLKEELFDPKLE